MWIIATAFVDVDRPRSSPDLANRLIPLGLILSVPVAAWDRTHWIAFSLAEAISFIGVLLVLFAAWLGLAARTYLGRSYSPRGIPANGGRLVRDGPYRWIRHPMYAAALLWTVGWPLVIASFLGGIVGTIFTVPAIWTRIPNEEAALLRAYGEEFAAYQASTWRLLPFIY